ncbi:TIM barrel protein [Porifericola rhodea]|uniref:hydroxypyruvate isomerase family protein n=1 Tax=Porifericola rhodea TaxID=930972 RepID=UPI00266590AF|nr:TIM barrel protein [Porifericola rhodea]WKN30692.1 TIM barrel protein [Porifericola rhodea]
MKRRDFFRSGIALGGTAATFSIPTLAKADQIFADKHKFKLKYAPHFGMFKSHAGEDLLDQLKFMSEVGFTALEDNGMMKRSPEMQSKIGDTLAKLDMDMGVFVVDKGGNSQNSLSEGKQEYLDIFLDGCRRAVEVAKRTNAKWMTVVPGNFKRDLPIGIQTANVVEALRRGAEILEPHGLVMVLEPLSDTPDLFLRTSDQTYLICKAVNSSACKILFDVYHMQKNEGHIIRNIDLTWDEIAYFQVGDNPGRKEPTTGEINYKNIFKHLYEKGYRDIVGMEHGNSTAGKEGEEKLINAYAEVDNFSV